MNESETIEDCRRRLATNTAAQQETAVGLRRLLWRRRDEQGESTAEGAAERFADGASPTPPDSDGSMGMVIVLHPNGTQTRTPVGRKPVTLGSAEHIADIAIDDPALRPVHMRITPVADGEFRVHGLERPPVRPFATNLAQPAEFVLASSGDHVKLTGDRGESVIHFFSSEAMQELDWGTSTTPPRPIELTEAAQFWAMRLRALCEEPDAYRTLFFEVANLAVEAWAERYEKAMNAGSEQLFVVGPPGEIFGAALVTLDEQIPSLATITQMWVNPEQRRNGAGTLLLGACEQWARAQGRSTITLSVTETYPKVRRLFQRNGYVMTGETEQLRSASPLVSERMTKDLPAPDPANPTAP